MCSVTSAALVQTAKFSTTWRLTCLRLCPAAAQRSASFAWLCKRQIGQDTFNATVVGSNIFSRLQRQTSKQTSPSYKSLNVLTRLDCRSQLRATLTCWRHRTSSTTWLHKSLLSFTVPCKVCSLLDLKCLPNLKVRTVRVWFALQPLPPLNTL